MTTKILITEMVNNKILLCIIVLQSIVFDVARAERPPSKYIQWTNISFGYSAPVYRNYKPAPTMNMNFTLGQTLFYRFGFMYCGYQFYPKDYSINSLLLAAGKRMRFINFHGSVFSGIAINWYELENPSQYELLHKWSKFNSLGFIGSAELVFRPAIFKEMGVGLEAFCNLNRVVNNFGLRGVLCFHDGR